MGSPASLHSCVGRMPGELERHGVARAHRERSDGGHVLAADLDRRAQAERVRTADRAQPAVDAAHPRHDRAVVEPHDELHLHRDPAATTFDEPDHIELIVAGRHAIDDRDFAFIRREDGLEHKRPVAVVPLDALRLRHRCEQPTAVVGSAEQRGEARARIESRERQPVDRTVAPDERGGLEVGQERVVGDAAGHHLDLHRRRDRVVVGDSRRLAACERGLHGRAEAFELRLLDFVSVFRELRQHFLAEQLE